ncbi:MAG: aminotransferase class V-fold PLP-dependent enzyme [Actinobacteria bacterium]|nr:aminotransferase class V-fold PLP-dependent enzyme [Actinomycetota bacterium]
MSSAPSCVDRPVSADRSLLAVVGADLDVPLVTGGTHRFVHLDYAASAPALCSVVEAVQQHLPWYSSVHRGAGFTSAVSSEALESARADIRVFVGGRADDVVVFTRNTTDALNLLASVIPPDTTVLTLDIEHHANLLPWRQATVRHLPTPATADEIPAVFRAALADIQTAHTLIAITGATNVTGEVLPIADIVDVARQYGARVAVDAAQLAPHRAIDIDALGVDYVVFSGHKLYAPFGAGVLVGRPDWLDLADPYLAGGGAVGNVSIEHAEWLLSPARHEGGTPNLLGAIAIAAACRALIDVGTTAIQQHDHALTAHLDRRLAAIDGVQVVTVFDGEHDRIGIATLALPQPAAVVAAALSAEHGIGTRDGAFCAHPLMRRLFGQTPLGPVPNALRVSFGVGSTVADLDDFADALTSILSDGPQWTYALERGRLVPSPDPRPRPVSA